MINKVTAKLVSKKDLISLPEYDNHFLVLHIKNLETKLDGYIAIHKKNGSFPSFGATRLLKYSSNKEALKDSLKLSKLRSKYAEISQKSYR